MNAGSTTRFPRIAAGAAIVLAMASLLAPESAGAVDTPVELNVRLVSSPSAPGIVTAHVEVASGHGQLVLGHVDLVAGDRTWRLEPVSTQGMQSFDVSIGRVLQPIQACARFEGWTEAGIGQWKWAEARDCDSFMPRIGEPSMVRLPSPLPYHDFKALPPGR